MKKRKLHQKILRSAAAVFALPETVVPRTCELYICGKDRVFISAHQGITCAEESCVAFQCDGFELRFYGDALCIDAVTHQSAVVRGRLSQICFA